MNNFIWRYLGFVLFIVYDILNYICSSDRLTNQHHPGNSCFMQGIIDPKRSKQPYDGTIKLLFLLRKRKLDSFRDNVLLFDFNV